MPDIRQPTSSLIAAGRGWAANHWLWLVMLVVFGLLLARDPFSTRTLIGNLEPYPDTFHYLVPPKCWLEGRGWRLCRPGVEGLVTDVPPLYSITLLPVLLTTSDPRVFYFVNVLLAVVAAWLFYDIINRLTANRLITAIALGLYVTNFFTSWLPQLAMAETLLLPLLLFNIWLLILPWRRWSPALAGLAVAALHGTKFAALPSMVVLFVAFIAKIWFEPQYDQDSQDHRQAVSKLVLRARARFTPGLELFLAATVVFLALGGWKSVLSLGIIQNLVADGPTPGSSASSAVPWYSPQYFSTNITHYWRSLSGLPARFLWDMTPIVPRWVALSGWLGLGLTAVKSRYRLVAAVLIATMLVQAGVLSLYFSSDSRYILVAIPSLLIGSALFAWWWWQRHQSFAWRAGVAIVLLAVGAGYALSNAGRWRQQLAVNFKYAETPWWLVASQLLDQTMAEQPANRRPIVITAMAPYLIDLYGRGGYDLLPLYQQQDFRGHKPAVWGSQHDYTDLEALYRSLLVSNRPVYLASYGLGNQPELKAAFASIQSNFSLELVSTGCHDLCNLYRLSLPTDGGAQSEERTEDQAEAAR